MTSSLSIVSLAEEVATFERDGHVLLRSVATREQIDLFRPHILETAKRLNAETRALDVRDTYGKAFLQSTNLWRHDERVKEFVLDPHFARTAARLLSVDRVRLYHDQALLKEPGGGRTPWHQDKYYWPLDTDNMVTMWMPLVDIEEDAGVMSFASGSHLHGPAFPKEISDESDELFRTFIADRSFPVKSHGPMHAGDATFHLGWTIHSAGPNITPSLMREVMTVIYFADGARVAPPNGPHQEADLAAFLGGRRPGEPADSELNPLLG